MKVYLQIAVFFLIFFFAGLYFSSTPARASYNCATCFSWWWMEHNYSGWPGVMGGLGTRITAQNMTAGDGFMHFSEYLVQHNGTDNCNAGTGTASVYIAVGFVNDHSRNGEYFDWADCRQNSVYYDHPGPWIPTGDYGHPMNFYIRQDAVSGQWSVHYDDYYGLNTISSTYHSTGNWMTPEAWRYGMWLIGKTGADTFGNYIYQSNNTYCPFNYAWNSSCSLTYYHGTSNLCEDDGFGNCTMHNIFGPDYPLAFSWLTYPQNSSIGGEFHTFIHL